MLHAGTGGPGWRTLGPTLSYLWVSAGRGLAPPASASEARGTIGGAAGPPFARCADLGSSVRRVRISHPPVSVSCDLVALDTPSAPTYRRPSSRRARRDRRNTRTRLVRPGCPPRKPLEEPAQPVPSVDVRLVQVAKAYGDVLAVDHIDLEVEKGEFFSLLGPSGCGKTTTLRMIGGFEQPTSGLIELQGAGRHLAAPVPAPRQYGLPELRALPPPDDLRERRLRPAPQGRQGLRGQGARHGDAPARRAPGLREA